MLEAHQHQHQAAQAGNPPYFDGPEHLIRWCCTRARQRAIDFQRRLAAERNRAEEIARAFGLEVELPPDYAWMDVYHEILQGLAPEYRRVWSLHVDGRSDREIAEEVAPDLWDEPPTDAHRQRVRTMRERVRALLERELWQYIAF